ncbi:MAG TPA: hypothetical protein VHY91_16705 [Pirellulales bacterium]|jgi:hypothetical protein|nr:hypothetical protein [Pirellulales bacterium]
MIPYTLTLESPGQQTLRANIEAQKPLTPDMAQFLFGTLAEHAMQMIAFGPTATPEWEAEKQAEQALAEALDAAKELAHLPGIENVLARLRIARRAQRVRRETVCPDGVAAFVAECSQQNEETAQHA